MCNQPRLLEVESAVLREFEGLGERLLRLDVALFGHQLTPDLRVRVDDLS